MFDSCNSKNIYDPNLNRTKYYYFQHLTKALLKFKNAIKIWNKNRKSRFSSCFFGVVWTITAMLKLYGSDKIGKQVLFIRQNKDYFITTYRQSQLVRRIGELILNKKKKQACILIHVYYVPFIQYLIFNNIMSKILSINIIWLVINYVLLNQQV